MTAPEVRRGPSIEAPAHLPLIASSAAPAAPGAAGTPFASRMAASGEQSSRVLRPRSKVLPEHARSHNRALVLQTLYRTGLLSRADVARATGLTRVTVSDLVAELIAEGIVVERGPSEDVRPGKPATMLDIDRTAFHIVGLDLSQHAEFWGAVLDLDGRIISRAQVPLASSTGEDAVAKVVALVETLLGQTSTPVLGIGVGSPGVVDLAGVVLSAPNLGWAGLELQALLHDRFRLPVIVGNDANAAVLAEHSFGDADSDLMLVKIGHGVGAGLLVSGTPLFGSRFAAGEIGHVVVGTDGGAACVCGKSGCLETWLSTPNLESALAAAELASTGAEDAGIRRDAVLREAGQRLGIALAPIVGALNLSEIVLSGPVALLDGTLSESTIETLRRRTMAEFHGDLTLRMTSQGDDIVLRGAAVLVLSARLGVS